MMIYRQDSVLRNLKESCFRWILCVINLATYWLICTPMVGFKTGNATLKQDYPVYV